MLDEKKLNEIKKMTEKLIKSGDILKVKEGNFTEFFLKNSRNSLDSSKLLYNVSNNKDLQKNMGFVDFNGYLWVINSSYYSMFYIVRALLEKNGIMIKNDILSVHLTVFSAFVYYFYLTGKIDKTFIEEFNDAGVETAELLGKEKAKGLVEDYFNEKDKRNRFTYEMGELAIQNKAKTSIDRAIRFNEEIRKMIFF